MTVCIGAVCCDKNGKQRSGVVVASDRMVTMGQLIEFEHEIPKLTQLTDSAVALVAGDALRGSRLVRDVSAQLTATGVTSVPQIAELAANHYSALRLAQVNDEFFRPRGLQIQHFYSILHQQLNPQLSVFLDNAAATFNYNVELLVGGVDHDGGHLFHIANPGGSYTPFHHTGFGAIGSGALHAVQSLIQLRQAPTHTLHETVFAVYASKRRAEVAPGVGVDTDMAIIDSTGIYGLDESTLKGLGNAYIEYSQPLDKRLLDEVQKLQLMPDTKAEAKIEPAR